MDPYGGAEHPAAGIVARALTKRNDVPERRFPELHPRSALRKFEIMSSKNHKRPQPGDPVEWGLPSWLGKGGAIVFNVRKPETRSAGQAAPVESAKASDAPVTESERIQDLECPAPAADS